MYIKSPKRTGDCYAAAVTESGERTRCSFPGAVVCDVDDVFVRFVMGSVLHDSAEALRRVVAECFEACPAWCCENGIETPAEVVSPMNVVSEGGAFLKARIPRDGHAFRVGDRYDVSVCVRDVKIGSGRMVVNWRVDGYREAPVSPSDDAPADVATETEPDAVESHESEPDAVAEVEPEVTCPGPDVAGSEPSEEEEAVIPPASDETAPVPDDVFECGLRSVRETLALLQSQMDEVEKAGRRGVCA